MDFADSFDATIPIGVKFHSMGKKIKSIPLLATIVFVMICVSCSSQVTETPTEVVMPSTSTPSPLPPSPTPTIDPRPTATSVPDVEGAVQIWLDWTAEEIQAITPHLNAFREIFPLVQIEISFYRPDEILERYMQGVSEGNAPDILIGKSQWGQQLYEEGLVRNITDRIPTEMVEIIYPVAWNSVQDGNTFFGLPLSMEGIVLYRNPEVVEEPADTIEVMAETLSDLEGENKVGAVVELGFLYTGAYISTCDGEFLDHEGQLALTHKAVECWLRLLKTIGESGPNTQNTDFDLNTFLNGGSGWLIEGSWIVDELISEFGEENIAIDPWPQYSAVGRNLTGYAWTRNIYFSSSVTDQEFDAAWVFARYLLTEEVQTSVAQVENGRLFPVLSELNFETNWLQEMMNAMQENIALPHELTLSFFTEELEPAAFDVVRRKYDPYWLAQWAISNIERAITFRGGKLQ
jgi:maltose-binding protein MalE